jgi:Flp pilus assembly pilin Flp
MQHILATLAGLTRADEGQDQLEYGVLTVLIAVVAIGALMLLGNQVNAVLWQTIVNNF